MGTESTETRTTERTLPTVVTGGVGLVCVALVAALVRWSRWWPHSDMRQIWASGLAWLAGGVALVTLVVASRRLDRRRRGFLLAGVVVAAVVGFVVGFELLRSTTADLR